MPNVKSKYINMSKVLHNGLVVREGELLSERTVMPNLKSKYFKIAELLSIALFIRVAELLSKKGMCQM